MLTPAALLGLLDLQSKLLTEHDCSEHPDPCYPNYYCDVSRQYPCFPPYAPDSRIYQANPNPNPHLIPYLNPNPNPKP